MCFIKDALVKLIVTLLLIIASPAILWALVKDRHE